MDKAIIKTDIKELKKLFSGKVRDIYEIEAGKWLIVTTDRLSAFDVVFNEGIPDKGRVLNSISNIWFENIDFIKNHLLSKNPIDELPFLKDYEGLNERSVIVRKFNRLPIECVVRGYLFGSVNDEYNKSGTVGGIAVKPGLKMAEKLPEPLFTPSTKADTGHDENINHSKFFSIVGNEIGKLIIDYSIQIYNMASEQMAKMGIILADTKFEFGIDEANNLYLVDEALTPDSSRYWDGESYKTGTSPKSYDKQFVRDYLNKTGWNKTPPPPPLPEDVIIKTREKYLQILDIIKKI